MINIVLCERSFMVHEWAMSSRLQECRLACAQQCNRNINKYQPTKINGWKAKLVIWDLRIQQPTKINKASADAKSERGANEMFGNSANQRLVECRKSSKSDQQLVVDGKTHSECCPKIISEQSDVMQRQKFNTAWPNVHSCEVSNWMNWIEMCVLSPAWYYQKCAETVRPIKAWKFKLQSIRAP